MAPYTCPNTECRYDKQLRPGQKCPLCSSEAKNFDFENFGSLLKEKQRFKKTTYTRLKQRQVFDKVKFCPKCGSPDVHFIIYYRPSIWKCSKCGYEGVFVVEGSEFADKIHEHHEREHENTN